ncbi:hypothetical protein Cgig2_027662 [Carnegiea gigantea]|uniref:GRAM domain-containing protein n=1 Tax=Carnegiea gigantea TaxID=171969 RepID=A0A9Q1GYA5_9CARY|nr:hypothetical protein Cgig2_027662 [Carnegiea gigantea]
MNVCEAFKSRSMKSMLGDQGLRIGMSRIPYDQTRKASIKLLPGFNSSHMRGTLILKQRSTGSVLSAMNKLVKDKLGLGAKILQVGGVEKFFRQIFSLREGEQLLKASQCCLSTTAGPIEGRLFISTHRLAAVTDQLPSTSPPQGSCLNSITRRAGESKNIEKTSQKYLQVITTDDFEFRYMEFLNYKRTFKSLQQAVSQSLI